MTGLKYIMNTHIYIYKYCADILAYLRSMIENCSTLTFRSMRHYHSKLQVTKYYASFVIKYSQINFGKIFWNEYFYTCGITDVITC